MQLLNKRMVLFLGWKISIFSFLGHLKMLQAGISFLNKQNQKV